MAWCGYVRGEARAALLALFLEQQSRGPDSFESCRREVSVSHSLLPSPLFPHSLSHLLPVTTPSPPALLSISSPLLPISSPPLPTSSPPHLLSSPSPPPPPPPPLPPLPHPSLSLTP